MKPQHEKKRQVEEMFDNIAPTYDRLNHLLSFQIDRLWRRRAVGIAARANPKTILDIATGTGDLAIQLANRMRNAVVTGVDISENMLEIGRQKVAGKGLAERIELRKGDAEALDIKDDSFDCVTAAFGVRNFGDIQTGLREMWRVTRRGGDSLIIEFSQPDSAIFGWAYRIYFHKILPGFGRAVSKDKNAYRYLPTSVGEFPDPKRFVEMLHEAGFSEVSKYRQTFGVAYIYKARKV